MLRSLHNNFFRQNSRVNTSFTKSKRFYFAASLKKKIELPSRIIKTPSEILLETKDIHSTFKILSEHFRNNKEESPFSNDIQHFLNYLGDKLQLNLWGKRFSIENGLIVRNPHTIDSSEHLEYLKEFKQKSLCFDISVQTDFMMKHSDVINHFEMPYIPDLLYLISQDIWNEFTQALPDQKVVALLNLSQHRHLWPAYNFLVTAIKDDNIKKYSAIHFGEYHFLMSFIPHYTGKDYNENWRRDSIKYYDQLDLIEKIGRNKSPIEILANTKPYLTSLFLNKFSHCPSFGDLEFIGENLVLRKAIDSRGNINKSKLHEIIAALPSSKKDPTAFSRMISDYRTLEIKLNDIEFTSSKCHLFYHQRKKFGQLSEATINQSEIVDYILELANNLLFPEFIRQILRHEKSEWLVEKILPSLINRLTKSPWIKLKLFALDHILALTDIKSLTSLESRWHRNLGEIEKHKPKRLKTDNWHALFERTTHNEVTFTCITNNATLTREGEEMNHCVGGYISKCTTGITHIVSVRSITGDRSTLELIVTKVNNHEEVKIVQNSAQHNSNPCPQISLASTKLLTMINNGSIPLNPLRGKIQSQKIDGQIEMALDIESSAYDIYPYNFMDSNIQEQIYQAYRLTSTLPTMLNANTYQEALKKSKFLYLINEEIETLINKCDSSIKNQF